MSVHSSASDILGGQSNPKPVLAAHRQMITAKIESIAHGMKANERVKQKYLWLALYHNRTIERLQARFGPPLSDEIELFKVPAAYLSF